MHFGIRYTGYGIDTGVGTLKSGIWDLGSGIWDLGSGFRTHSTERGPSAEQSRLII